MFEEQKWSKALKEAAKLFMGKNSFGVYEKNLVELIELAMEEAREEVLNDPREYGLINEDDYPPDWDDEDCL